MLLKKDQGVVEDKQINSCEKCDSNDSFNQSEIENDFKSLICPLCFNFIYKCQTTVCGHSFCTKCIDEYLIIKQNCFVCKQRIRTPKGTVLLACF